MIRETSSDESKALIQAMANFFSKRKVSNRAIKLTEKLMYILECLSAKFGTIISWSLDGKSVIVHNREAFVDIIIATFFKKGTFDSFCRKMRRWGFTTKSVKHGDDGEDKWAFHHPDFNKAGSFGCCERVMTTAKKTKKSDFEKRKASPSTNGRSAKSTIDRPLSGSSDTSDSLSIATDVSEGKMTFTASMPQLPSLPKTGPANYTDCSFRRENLTGLNNSSRQDILSSAALDHVGHIRDRLHRDYAVEQLLQHDKNYSSRLAPNSEFDFLQTRIGSHMPGLNQNTLLMSLLAGQGTESAVRTQYQDNNNQEAMLLSALKAQQQHQNMMNLLASMNANKFSPANDQINILLLEQLLKRRVGNTI